MKIGIDIQAAIGKPTGVGRYAIELVRGLAGLEGEEQFRLFYFDFRRRGCGVTIANPRFGFKPMRFMPGRAYEALSENIGWPDIARFAGRCDLYHFPNFIIPPLKRGKAVVTVHDLSFARSPDYTEARNRRRLQKRFLSTLKRADAIITISEFSKRELMDLYGIPAGRITVTYLGVEMSPPPAAPMVVPHPFFMFVGSVEPRKNLGTLLDAWRIVKSRRPHGTHKLLIVGAPGWGCAPAPQQVKERGLENDVIVREYVEHRDLPALYCAAEALVFPSVYEGFGLPPLEAMACGAPVVASNAPSIPEIVGDAALLFDPRDPEGIARALMRISDDRELRKTLVARGHERVKLFTWRTMAEGTLALYRRLLN